jgi:hypothetical protein
MINRSDEGRARAESIFKKKEHQTQQNEKVWAEHNAAGRTADAHRQHLKSLRLAKEAADQADAQPGSKARKRPAK